MDRGNVGLRNRNVHAQRIGLRQVEHLLGGGAAVARIDQRADVHIALRDDPGEWSVHVLEGFQVLETLDVGLGRWTMACLAE